MQLGACFPSEPEASVDEVPTVGGREQTPVNNEIGSLHCVYFSADAAPIRQFACRKTVAKTAPSFQKDSKLNIRRLQH